MDDKKPKMPESIRKKISKAMKGNNNAEKWTEDLVIEILNKMIDVLEKPYQIELDSTEEEKNVSGKAVMDEQGNLSEESKSYTKKKVRTVKRTTHLKHELLMIFKIRNAKWFSDMADKFKNKNSVLHLLEYINKTCMVNTYNDAANGATNSTMAKMNLSTHHKWSDRVESEVKHDGAVKVETPDVPKDVMEAFKKASKIINPDND